MDLNLKSLMSEAARLTRTGNLRAATAAIQSALHAQPRNSRAPEGPASPVIDVELLERPGGPQAEVSGESSPLPTGGRFIAGSYADAAASRDYKLYIPPGAAAAPLPLVVMLHGCTQNPDDFAAGTAMNELAEAHGFYVLYPAQSRKANPQACWNWFKHSHQQRGRADHEQLALERTCGHHAEHTVGPLPSRQRQRNRSRSESLGQYGPRSHQPARVVWSTAVQRSH